MKKQINAKWVYCLPSKAETLPTVSELRFLPVRNWQGNAFSTCLGMLKLLVVIHRPNVSLDALPGLILVHGSPLCFI